MKFLDAARQLTALGFSEQPQLNASPQQRLKHLQQCSPTAVVLMAIMNVDGQAELLLTKRSRQLALHPGEIAFPGGKPESSDADCVATALREADEEVAMPPSAVNYLGQLNKRITRSGFLLTPCVVLVEPVVDLNPNPNEVEAIFTIPLAHLARPGYWQFTLQEGEGAPSLTPQLHYRGHVLTGVTARLTADLMASHFGVLFPHYN